VLYQVAGRIKGKAVDLVFGVCGLAEAAHRIVAELPGAFVAVVSGDQLSGGIVFVAALDLAADTVDGLVG